MEHKKYTYIYTYLQAYIHTYMVKEHGVAKIEKRVLSAEETGILAKITTWIMQTGIFVCMQVRAKCLNDYKNHNNTEKYRAKRFDESNGQANRCTKHTVYTAKYLSV